MSRRVQISDNMFGGFNMIMHVENMSDNDIVCIIILALRDILQRENLVMLITELERRSWHIHGRPPDPSTIYVCSHT